MQNDENYNADEKTDANYEHPALTTLTFERRSRIRIVDWYRRYHNNGKVMTFIVTINAKSTLKQNGKLSIKLLPYHNNFTNNQNTKVIN